MLLPTLRRARETAKSASCQSNLHQIGLGIHMYCNDNDGTLPYARTFPWEAQAGQPDPGYLQDLLIPYVGGKIGAQSLIFRCLGAKPQWIRDSTNSYRYNYFFADGWNIPQTTRKLDRVTVPTQAVLHYDMAWEDWPFTDLPHDGVNALYCDGHVGFVKGEWYLPNGNEQTGRFCSDGW